MESISLNELRNYIINLCKSTFINKKKLLVDGEIIEFWFSDYFYDIKSIPKLAGTPSGTRPITLPATLKCADKEGKVLECDSKNKEINNILNSIYDTNRLSYYLNSNNALLDRRVWFHFISNKYKYLLDGQNFLKLIDNDYILHNYFCGITAIIYIDHYIVNFNPNYPTLSPYPNGAYILCDNSDLYEIIHEYIRTVLDHSHKAINDNGDDNNNDNNYDGEELA